MGQQGKQQARVGGRKPEKVTPIRFVMPALEKGEVYAGGGTSQPRGGQSSSRKSRAAFSRRRVLTSDVIPKYGQAWTIWFPIGGTAPCDVTQPRPARAIRRVAISRAAIANATEAA